jgi:CheY-like chemotaxis protein
VGYEIDSVENGRLAVEAMRDGHYDLVLMDIQMPEMDGWEASKAIRKLESARGGRTPILAMTAAVMKEETEKCFAAGMDGCVFKPIDPDQLYRMLDTHTQPRAASASSRHVPPRELNVKSGQADGGTIMNLDKARQRIPGGQEEFNETTRLLIEQCNRIFTEIRDSITARDVTVAKRGLHTLRGSASIFDAHLVISAVDQLDSIIDQADIIGTAEPLTHIEREIQRLTAALASYLESHPG